MAATREDISRWFQRGIEQGASHLLVVCDTFEYEDYPVFATGARETWDTYRKYDGVNMQSIMEVYDLALPLRDQLNEDRARHLPPPEDNSVP